jgi:hypothetical protein
MDPFKLVNAWYDVVTKAFTEHAVGTAVISIAAIGILVVLQKEYRPYRLWTNAAFVFLGWVVSITALPAVMVGFRDGLKALEPAAPWAHRIARYLYGIYERHPLLVLVIVGLGATFYFLKRSWPLQVAWGPIRAVCTVFGIVLMVHITGPIADLIAGEPAPAATPKKFNAPATPAKDAVAQAIKGGDVRYVSVPTCIDEVAGYPVPEAGKPDLRLPPEAAVKKLGPSCDDTFGNDAVARAKAYREYAAEYNRLMYDHHKVVAEPKGAEPKALDAKAAEPKVADPKAVEPKAVEPKVTANNAADAKGEIKQ